MVSIWEKSGFNNAGVVFKRDEFHGVAFFTQHGFAGNQSTGNLNPAAKILSDIFAFDDVLVFQLIIKQCHGVPAA